MSTNTSVARKPSRANARTLHTLQLILLQHKHEAKLPHLTGITTLFSNLLMQNADDTAWQLFHQVASLPLLTTHLEVSCVANGMPCEQRAKRGHCWHAQVEVTHTVTLEPVDHHLFDKGRRINGPQVMSWWGDQMARALGNVNFTNLSAQR